MSIVRNYNEALKAIYDHVGFKEDWVFYPIQDCTNYYWRLTGKYCNKIIFAESVRNLNDEENNGNFYEYLIFPQRFYKKHIYEGANYTMIFTDSQTDGMKYFSVFDNSKRIND